VVIATKAARAISRLRRLRVASGASRSTLANASDFHPGIQGAGKAIPDDWFVVIWMDSLPVASAATLLVEGLKTQVAYVGSELHWNAND
jgi:hypothetical protein